MFARTTTSRASRRRGVFGFAFAASLFIASAFFLYTNLLVHWQHSPHEAALPRERGSVHAVVDPFDVAVPNDLMDEREDAPIEPLEPAVAVKSVPVFARAAMPAVQAPLGSYPRLYCVVPTMRRPDKYDQWKAILETWGPECDELRFTVDPTDKPSASNPNTPYNFTHNGATALVVPLTDLVRKRGNQCRTNRKDEHGKDVFTPCHHIWEKVWRGWVWVKDHELDRGDYFFKIDDDTYVLPHNMRWYVLNHGWRATDKHYFGHVLYTLGKAKPMVAGAMAGMSRATLDVLAERYRTMEHEYGDRNQFKHGRCVDRDGATEEVTTSRCMREINVHPEALFDDVPELGLVQPHIMIWQPKDLFVKARRNPESWYFSGQPKNMGQLDKCCSPRPIAIHFQRDPQDMRQLYLVTHDVQNSCYLEKHRTETLPLWQQMVNTTMVRGVSGQVMSATAAMRELDYFDKVQALLRAWRGVPPAVC